MNLRKMWAVGLYIVAAAWLTLFMIDDSLPVSLADDHMDSGPQPLPASLAKLYPPEADRELFYEYMLGMEQIIGAVEVNLREGDMENALKAYEALQGKYKGVADLVPEWEHYLDLGAFDEISSALTAQDQAGVMGGMMRLGQSCENCHHDNMARVTLLYRFKRMHELTIDDPVSGEKMPYKLFKHELAYNFSGIGTDFMEGQLPKAREHYEQFNQRFSALADSCLECHEVERRYFVDPEMQKIVNTLGEQLNAEQPDPERTQRLMETIGTDTCGKCHMVHVAGSYAPYYIQTAK